MIPATMTAITIKDGKGDANALTPTQIGTPQVRPGEILIAVRAAGVNRPDVLQRQGLYPPPQGAPQTLGLEIAGEVVVGAGRWHAGDRVCALLAGGGYAQYAVVDARHALPIPPGYDFVQAAALPETVFTVFANVFEHGDLQSGETLLVHGATSGIGVAAIQMGVAAGARVIATARGRDKAKAALALGADMAIDASAEDFGEVVREAGGCDVILDMVGGAYFDRNLAALRNRGRIVYIAAQDGETLSVPVFALMTRQAVITGSTLRRRDVEEKARLAEAVEDRVWPWIAEGKVRAVVDKTFALAEAAAAHAHLESGGHVGKVVLTL